MDLQRIFLSPPDWDRALLSLLIVSAACLLLAELGARLLRAAIRGCLGEGNTVAALKSPVVKTPTRLARLAIFCGLLLTLVPPALEAAGSPLRHGLRLAALSAWATGGGLRLLLIIVIAAVLARLVSLGVGRFEQSVSEGTSLEVLERAKRAKTLGGLVRNVLTTTILIVAGLMVLREVGLDITPILTGAGILGLAIGFGAQTLVKDILSGFFMILENEIRVGDVVAIDTHAGIVEAMNLRTIVLRDLEGTVHIIPNGSITAVRNRTKDFSYYVVDMPAAYNANTDEVVAVIKEVGAALRADPAFAPFILDNLEVLGVDGFADSSVIIKFRIKTMPLKQWEVGRELRRRLKQAYDANGIEFPFPTRTLFIPGRHDADAPQTRGSEDQ